MSKRPHRLRFIVHVDYEIQCESLVHAAAVEASLRTFYEERPYRIEPMDKMVLFDTEIIEGGHEPVELAESDSRVDP